MSANFTHEGFELADWSTWGPKYLALYWAVVVIGQEMMHLIIVFIGSQTLKRIPESGKFLETFGWKDWLFVYINRFSVPVMTYHLFRFTWLAEGHVEWEMTKLTFANTLGSLIALFMVYDIFYVPFHAFLHVRGIYKYIHKHHHGNAAPSRGNLDASNTHPIEFILGEYIHLLAVYLVPCHIVTVFLFIAVGGILASLNHTRFDVGVPFFYDVRAHDKHHHIPQSNYAQYSMWLDKIVGTFQEHSKPAVHIKKA